MDYPTPIVSAAWLHDHIEAEQVQVVDCRFALMDPTLGIRQYQSGHIPGAVHLDLNRDLSSPVQPHGGRHPLPNIDTLAKTLGQCGIQSQKTFVVAYDDSRFAFAARLWWLLRYMGHEQVAVLDGGLLGWQNAGYGITQDIPERQSVVFEPYLQSDWVVDINHVKQHKDLPGVVLVDSRQGDRYRGEREPIDPVAGHIPGAVNLFWQDVTTSDGHAKSVELQQARWRTADPSPTRPITQADEIIVYCGSGVTACVNLLSLELAGIAGGKLYAGSWSDWCSYL
ncbi:MAG: sulfurtransferase [Merismopedia sp. SIO2A8]|nr:sulfurtransferase [Symploca sp. SIO2B6]NET47436.1 sulfurtransferase [Merismopedia sp. SIO2A8]